MDSVLATARARLSRQQLLFGLLALITTLALTPTAFDLVRLWAVSSSYHHGFFVAPAAIWMIRTYGGQPAPTAGRSLSLALLMTGALIWILAQAASFGFAQQISFVLTLIGAIGLVWGDNALKQWAWPLLVLFFMVPAGESLLPVLQNLVAQSVVAMLGALSFDIAINGVVIDTSVGAFAIVEACAGLRLLISAVMVSAVFAYAAFEGWSRRIGFVAFAAAFAIITNIVRVFLLIAMAVLTNRASLDTLDHLTTGWVVYIAALIALAFIGMRFANREQTPAADIRRNAPAARPFLIAAGALALVSLYSVVVIDRPIKPQAPHALPSLSTPGWRILPESEDWRAQTRGADRVNAMTFDQAGEQIYATLSYFTHDRRGHEIVSTGADPRWSRIGGESAVIYLFRTAKARAFSHYIGPEGQRVSALTVYWLGDDLYFDRASATLALTMRKLTGRNAEGGAITLAAPYKDDPAQAIERLKRFTADIEPFAVWRARLEAAR